MREEIFRLEHATKRMYGGPVLSDYKINLYRSETVSLCGVKEHEHALILSIFSGVSTLDGGSLYLFDKPFDIKRKPLGSRPEIVCIRKKPNLIRQLSVGENLFVVKKNARKLFLNKKTISLQTDYLLHKAGLTVGADDLVSSCTPAQQHLIELIRASIQNVKLIVLEDILEAYTDKEKATIINYLSILRSNGCAVLYLSFYPQQLISHSDRILLMHAGRHLRTYYPGEISADDLSHEVQRQNKGVSPFPTYNASGNVVFSVKGLKAPWTNHLLSMDLHEGEVLGCYDNESKFSGLFLRIISGEERDDGIFLNNVQFRPKSLSHAARQGLILIPDDLPRKAYLENLTISENLTLPILQKNRLAGGFINERIKGYLEKQFNDFMNTYFEDDAIDGVYLKLCVLFFRWILYRPKVIICMEPYAYSDELVRKIVATFLRVAASEGIGVIVFSNQNLKLRSICDRVVEMSL